MIKESPEELVIPRLNINADAFDRRFNATTFWIIKNTIIMGVRGTWGHYEMPKYILNVIHSKNNLSEALDELERIWKIVIINPSEDVLSSRYLNDKFLRNFRLQKDVIAGRFFGIRKGFVTFWNKKSEVIQKMDLIKQIIAYLGYNFNEIYWEDKYPDTDEYYRYVSYKTFVTRNLNAKDDDDDDEIDFSVSNTDVENRQLPMESFKIFYKNNTFMES